MKDSHNTVRNPTKFKNYYNSDLEIAGNYNKTLIFSDDIEWSKQNLPYKKIHFVENFNEVG